MCWIATRSLSVASQSDRPGRDRRLGDGRIATGNRNGRAGHRIHRGGVPVTTEESSSLRDATGCHAEVRYEAGAAALTGRQRPAWELDWAGRAPCLVPRLPEPGAVGHAKVPMVWTERQPG